MNVNSRGSSTAKRKATSRPLLNLATVGFVVAWLAAGAAVVVVLLAVGVAESSPASPTSGPLIEFWDGTGWAQQVSPNPNGTGEFSAVSATSATDAWAIGSYFTGNGKSALAAHWDGSSWQQVAMPTPKRAEEIGFEGAVAISATDVWAVGFKNRHTLTEHWNGSAWRIVQSPSPGRFAHLGGVAAVSPRNVWAVGDYVLDGASRRTLVLHWNGTTWRRIPSPHPGFRHPGSRLSGVAVISARSVWAVGSYSRRVTSVSRTYQTLTLHWNGKKWSQVRSSNPGGDRKFNALYGVAAVERNKVWAVGSFSTGHSPSPPLVERWNGNSWQSFPAPVGCPYSSTQPLTDLDPLAPNDIWAVGAGIGPYPCEGRGDPSSQALAEHWNGHSWSVSSIVNPAASHRDGFLGIAAATPHAVWAVGYH